MLALCFSATGGVPGWSVRGVAESIWSYVAWDLCGHKYKGRIDAVNLLTCLI
jgi:hypothetical protein